MRVLLKEDILVKPWRGGVNVGIIPKGVGWERLRYDHRINKVVDLMNLSEIYVRYKDGNFELHAVPVPTSQPVSMRYFERHKLRLQTVGVEKSIILLSDQEFAIEQADRVSSMSDNRQLKQRLVELVASLNYDQIPIHVENVFGNLSTDQKTTLKAMMYVLLYLAKKELRK